VELIDLVRHTLWREQPKTPAPSATVPAPKQGEQAQLLTEEQQSERARVRKQKGA
jgi:hypothetical protein